MGNNKKIVIQITNIWPETESVFDKRERNFTEDDIEKILLMYPVELLGATVGGKLNRICFDKSFNFW